MTAAAGTLATSVRSVGIGVLAIPATLYTVALVVRLWATGMINFPLTEGSAYYVAVARNLVLGRGLEIDAIWSYATPPLTLPRPAFELWQPAASLVAALPMTALGPSFDAAQLGFALLGALLAPLTWVIARDAALHLELDERRVNTISVGSGVLAAVAGPLVLPAAVPDSTLPFTVLAIAACAAIPGAITGERRAIVALGVLLGLAYLTRMEAVWYGLIFAALAVARVGLRAALPRALAVAALAAVLAAPLWLRNIAIFGTPLPGQVGESMFLTRNEQIFAYLERPSLDGFLGQGVATIVGNVALAAQHNLVDVLLVPGGAFAAVGLVTLAVSATRRVGSLRRLGMSPLTALVTGSALTFAATTLLFPVATLWGTFEHAAGPAAVALIIVATIGADAAVARIRSWRSWPRSNSWLAPVGLVALAVPLTFVQVSVAATHAAAEQRTMTGLRQALGGALTGAGVVGHPIVISDRPIWLSDALDSPVIALPDEPTGAVLRLARDLGAAAVVVVEGRGRHPAALREPGASGCFVETPLTVVDAPSAGLFTIARECVR